MATPRGLGKGLDALFQEKIDLSLDKEKKTFMEIDITKISPNPNQPRKDFSEESIEELAQSIKNQGLLQPILVRPLPGDLEKYQIVAGERRFLACQKAGLNKIPAIVVELTDEECLIVALVENLQREDLNCMEEARALNEIKNSLGLTQEELAARVGKSRPHVANCLRLLNLDNVIQKGLEEEIITPGHGRALLAIASSEDRILAYNYVASRQLSVRDVEKIAGYWKKNGCLPSYCLVSEKNKRRSNTNKNDKKKLLDIKKKLQKKIGLKTLLRGTLSQGTITIKYNSSSELYNFLSRLELQLPIEENVSHETISEKDLPK